jgi:hypothetical protein
VLPGSTVAPASSSFARARSTSHSSTGIERR